MAKCKEIVRHFKQSGKSANLLRTQQEKDHVAKALNLIQECKTRWNSGFRMMERMIVR
jgi:hypothetical protein